ncbi:beta-galactosidase [Microbacterium sp. SS28]|uniref:beta-galactosidase n=1 Tax=Microbacterium sp. SS28 TaxID=2919948 RepID=UPI001FAA34CA|nr:beta-galactosidase [Microbacterium sp. SS28]
MTAADVQTIGAAIGVAGEPPVEPASAVRMSTAGLSLHGRDEVLLCASLFPFRIPREEWGDRLAAVRASGYQVIDVYLPWNFHELSPGEWDFTGRRDVGAFLDLAHEAGLSVIARPGPYICSEWDGGALPAWLALEDGLRIRQAEPRFLAHVEQWFARAMPIIAERQADAGGAVIAVQLENELDFFDTADRHGYLTALRDLALAAGITVPLIACAGQGDMTGATGGVEGVVPTFNFYPDDDWSGIEPLVRRYTDMLAEQGLPLLVTETNRVHRTLRRLLVSGARVIAPYLQASGYNFGYTPSVGNWGDPGGFMSHDYDFHGFLSPTGEARPEHAEARVLAAVVRALGPALARAGVEEAAGAYRTDAPTSTSPSRLLLDGGGSLLGIPNLGDVATDAALPAEGGLPEVTLPLPPKSCALVTRELPLERFGLPGTLAIATADLVGADADGIVLATRGPSVLGFSVENAGEPVAGIGSLVPAGAGIVLAELPAPTPGAPVRGALALGTVEWSVTVWHSDELPDADGAAPIAHASQDAEPAVLTEATGLDVPTRAGEVTRHDVAPTSESLGVHRGRVHYSADVSEAPALLIEGASDIVDLSLEGRALPTIARFGATALVETDGATRLDATVETWGHANFDDSRLPALRLGSLRGIGRVWRVIGQDDVTGMWTIDGPGTWAGQPAPLPVLGGWSSTRVGLPITYRRDLSVDGTHHHALAFAGVPGSIAVEVDGRTRIVTAEDPWLHLAPGEGRDIAVSLAHQPGALGGATLFRLDEVRGWDVEPQPDTALVALAGAAASGTPTSLPLRLEAGDEAWLEIPIPDGAQSLRFEGSHVRVSVFAAGELLGRVWLSDAARPRFTGGDAGRVIVPAAWNSGSVRVLVHATAGETAPELSAVLAG